MIYPKRYLVTSALPYANGPLHIGHLAGAYIASDIYVRMHRLLGNDILHVCGSDEHGAAVTMRAQKEGTSPREIVDRYHTLFAKTFKDIGIAFDIYHRTSAELHHQTSQEFFTALNDKGEFIQKTTDQYFDSEAGQFLADRYIKGQCPKCNNPEAYGDQCENCGSTLSPTELINPVSTLTGQTPELRQTTHWYIQLDKYAEWLGEWIENGKIGGIEMHDPATWKNHVIGQCKSWIEGGLQPRSITRDLDWGVDVPQDIPGSEGKKLYVWLDAPIGYISATKQWALDNDKDWRPYWQDEETALIHFIGKDNIVFHCLIFPAILKARGDYILPVNVPANQFMNLEGEKISTSKNWAVWVHEYLEDLPGKEDVLRYYLIKNMPEQRDSEFTWQGYQDANNNELVNNLGNFIQRVFVLTNKYYEGIVPDFDPDCALNSAAGGDLPSWHDAELLDLHDKLDEVCRHILAFNFRSALTSLMGISAAGNQLLQFNEPWKTQKEDPELVKVVMNLAVQYVAALSVATRPFMPFTSDKLRRFLNLPAISATGEFMRMMADMAEGNLIVKPGHKIERGEHLFSRIDDSTIAKQLEKLQNMSKMANPDTATAATGSTVNAEPLKPEIGYDDFAKMDLRAATILSAEKVPKTDKLLKLELDLGFERRTVVSGIAKYHDPSDVVGNKVVLLANLAPRKIRGVESRGMLLFAENANGELYFVSPVDGAENGSAIN